MIVNRSRLTQLTQLTPRAHCPTIVPGECYAKTD